MPDPIHSEATVASCRDAERRIRADLGRIWNKDDRCELLAALDTLVAEIERLRDRAVCSDRETQEGVDRLYVKVFMTGTTHLASFENESSVASFCGRSWPHGNVGTSRERPRGPLCFVCRRVEARHLRDD